MKTIITGASGDYGRRVADLMVEKIPPNNLILTTRTPEKLAGYAKRGATVRYADFDKPEILPEAFEGGERMLMISTIQVGRRTKQHGAAIDAAKAAGVRHIVYTSFVGIDPKNPALVVFDHRQTEDLLKNSGLSYTMLRDSQYAEALVQNNAVRAAESGQWMASAAEGKIALVAHADCVECAAAVLSGSGHENKIYNITGPELLSFGDVAAMAAKISNKPVTYKVVSDDDMYAMWDSLGIPREYVEGLDVAKAGRWASIDMVTFEQAIREGYFAVISEDVKKLLGREPVSVWDVFQAHRHLFDF